MSAVCEILEAIRRGRTMVDRDALEELLFAAGFDQARDDGDVAVYTHPNHVRLTIRIGAPGFLAAGTVARAIEAVEQVVVCDES